MVNESETPLDSFLFDKVFFDSEIKHQNVTDGKIKEAVVFTKIPKNSIKIPVAGGGSYSPDFAYIIKTADGETLNLVVESKDVDSSADLRGAEAQKIHHAQKWFESLNACVKVQFSTQFKADKIQELIKKSLNTSDEMGG